jgi:hypothetical protein
MEKPGETAGTVLVAVPGGKGLMSTLAKQGFRVRACKNLTEVIKRFDRSTDAIVLGASNAGAVENPSPGQGLSRRNRPGRTCR